VRAVRYDKKHLHIDILPFVCLLLSRVVNLSSNIDTRTNGWALNIAQSKKQKSVDDSLPQLFTNVFPTSLHLIAVKYSLSAANYRINSRRFKNYQ
jgi:hypothetical protein